MSAKGLEAIVRAMRDDERERMLELLLEAMAGELPPEGDEARDACPRCGCTHVVRRGRDADGGQGWLCRGCGRTFRASTGRTLATTRLPTATWHLYARLMAGGATPGSCAAACGVSLRTSFSMRHRLLEAVGSSLPAFEAGPGCAARADETLVPDSLSGNHTLAASGFSMPRPARRRGGDGAMSGVSGDKVSVLVCANVRGGVFLREACRGKLGVGSAREALAGCALAGAVVSTDRQKGYVRALAEMGMSTFPILALFRLRPRARGDGRGGAPEVRVLGTEGAAQSRERDPLGTQGVPCQVPRRVHQEAPRPPRVARVVARGPSLRRPDRAARRPAPMLPVSTDVETESRRAVPVPPRARRIRIGLTQPMVKILKILLCWLWVPRRTEFPLSWSSFGNTLGISTHVGSALRGRARRQPSPSSRREGSSSRGTGRDTPPTAPCRIRNASSGTAPAGSMARRPRVVGPPCPGASLSASGREPPPSARAP